MVIDLSWLTKYFGDLPSDPAFTTALTGTILGSFGIGAIAYLILMAYCVLLIASRWKMFRAAGDKGWKSLIPIYNEYTEYKLTWSKKAFWVYFILSLSGAIIFIIGVVILVIAVAKASAGASVVIKDFESFVKESTNLIKKAPTPWIIGSIVILLGNLIMCAVCVMKIISLYHISKAYNHGFGYFAGLFFFESTFRLIIGFDTGLTYVGNAAARKGIVEEPKKNKKKAEIPENPAYTAPAYTAPTYTAPAPAAPEYNAYNTPAPAAPEYNAPAPAAPEYNTPAPAAPEYNAYNPQAPVYPEYNAPAPAAEAAAFAAAGVAAAETAVNTAAETTAATAEAAAETVQTTAEAAAESVANAAENATTSGEF